MKKITRQDRINWLLNNQSLWQGWPNVKDIGGRIKEIVMKMKKDGVVSLKTYWLDVNLHNLIIDARAQRRKKAK